MRIKDRNLPVKMLTLLSPILEEIKADGVAITVIKDGESYVACSGFAPNCDILTDTEKNELVIHGLNEHINKIKSGNYK